ncbi:MAG: hypothetical protein PHW47_07285 [Lachnospira sp.]|nr:hypothetical protein [Lachnospira sp.]
MFYKLTLRKQAAWTFWGAELVLIGRGTCRKEKAMGIAGVGGYQYPNYYGVQNSGRNSGEVFGATCTEQVAPTNLILHGDSDEYGKVYGALGSL